ncbi:MAG: T9SS type A sorting domain-containing protein [Melioribacteraceae bacterium]|nr:T9SS type A sorting domain-containing protein [Melioribacteraceae bacterium]
MKFKPQINRRIFFICILIALCISYVSYDYTTDKSYSELKSEKRRIKLKTKIERNEYFFNILKNPETKSIPKNIRQRELAFAEQLRNEFNLRKVKSTKLEWEEAGPTDVGGRTRALAVDLNNSNIVLAGGVNGGIWKSTDKGSTWVLKSDPSQDLSVSSICQDPSNPSIWYYTAGELDHSANDFSGSAHILGSGIYKSTDNGETWDHIKVEETRTEVDSPTDFISKIQVSKTSGSIFFTGGYVGLLKSTDGGKNFTHVFGDNPLGSTKYYEFDISEDGKIIVATSISENLSSEIDGGVYLSTDDGVNFNEITPDDYKNLGWWDRVVVAFAPSDNNTAYIWADAYDDQFESIPLFHKIDLSGSEPSIVDRSANLPDFGGQVGELSTQNSYNMILEVKPDDPNFVLLGGTNLFRSFDGFATKADDESKNWIGGYATSNDISEYNNHHADQHALFFDPENSDALWSGHDGGLSYIQDINEVSLSIAWQDKNQGYNVTQFYRIDIGNVDGNFYLGGGTQDNGTPLFNLNNGEASESSDISSGDGGFMFIGDSYVVNSAQNGRVGIDFLDGNWSIISPATPKERLFIHPIVLDPSDDNVLFYPTGKNLMRNVGIGSLQNFQESDDGWQDLGDISANDDVDAITALGMAKDGTLYCGLSGEGHPQLIKIKNAKTATNGFENVSISAAHAGSYVHDIAVNELNSDELLVIFSNYNVESVFYSNDGGATYSAVQGNLAGTQNDPGPSVRAAEIIEFEGEKYYFVATSIGVFSTTLLNEDQTDWVWEGEETIGTTVTNDIVSIPTTGDIAVGTHGRGIFTSNIKNTVSGIKNNQKPESFLLSQNYPNPFNPSTTIEYIVPKTNDHSNFINSTVTLGIYDILGNHIRTLINEEKAPGNYRFNFDAEGLASGTYIYKLNIGNITDAKKMVLIR